MKDKTVRRREPAEPIVLSHCAVGECALANLLDVYGNPFPERGRAEFEEKELALKPLADRHPYSTVSAYYRKCPRQGCHGMANAAVDGSYFIYPDGINPHQTGFLPDA
ncbi:MAG TPA: hypothetical protein VJ836_05490 [Candidatus Saccharimonadales bacterium]|nr:hypothetical protein [Candidatus Saccharimonadales bacterium]